MAKIGIVKGRVRALVRVSTDQQNPKSQLDVLEAFAAQEEFSYQKIVTEPHRRRGHGRSSPEFSQLIEDGENKMFDWLVVDHSNRLGAYDSDEYGYWVTKLKWAKIRVWAINRGELTKADGSTAMMNTLDHIGSYDERTGLAERVSRGVREKAKMGFVPFAGSYPTGYDRECVAERGEVLFRVVLEGKTKRVIYPDGQVLLITAKHTYPGKSKYDHYRPVLSLDPPQIQLVKDIFNQFVNEAITPFAIARLLVKKGIKNVQDKPWTRSQILYMLQHPMYTGRIFTNRTSSARYKALDKSGANYIDGQRTDKNKAVCRAIPREDWVEVGHFEHLRIIDDKTWNDAQTKLTNQPTRVKAPTQPDLWLRAFVRCGGCGQPMHGVAKKGRQLSHKYRCYTYIKNHRTVANACRPNYVSQDLIEEALGIACQGLAGGVFANTPDYTSAIDKPFNDMVHLYMPTSVEYQRLLKEVKADIKRFTGGTTTDDDLKGYDEESLLEYYRHLYDAHEATIKQDIAAAYADLKSLMGARKGLSENGPAWRLNSEDIAAAEAWIVRLESSLVPLDERLDAIHNKQVEMMQQFVTTAQAIKEGNKRERAEALSKVIRSITVHFKENTDKYRPPGHKGSNFQDLPVRITFEPIEGQPFEYTIDYPKS